MFWYEKILEGKPADECKSFKIEDNANLKWIANQTSNNSYQLIESGTTIGSLIFPKKSKRIAAGKIAGKEFKIKKHWLFASKILIEQSNSLIKHAMIITDFNKDGMIEFDNKERVFWNRYKHLENEWAFSAENNKKLIVFKPVTSIYTSGYFVEIKNKYLEEQIAAVLLLLGIFILMTMGEETGITSAFI